MRNIISLLKYNFGKYHTGTSKILYIIGFSFLIINTFSILVAIPGLREVLGLLNIGFISTLLSINLILAIVRFIRQISKEKGKLLFTLPVKSNEFLISKILEFIIVQGAIVIVAYIMALILPSSVASLIRKVSISVAYGTTVSYIIIISFITIAISYIKNTALSVISVLIGGSIITGIADKIINLITNLFPYLYINIGGFVEIDIMYFLLSLASIIGLVYLAIYHLEKKLDII